MGRKLRYLFRDDTSNVRLLVPYATQGQRNPYLHNLQFLNMVSVDELCTHQKKKINAQLSKSKRGSKLDSPEIL